MNVNKPNYIKNFERGNISSTPLKKSSEYVPLFTVLNNCRNSGIFWNVDHKFNPIKYEPIPEDSNINSIKKINIKFKDVMLNQFQVYIFKRLASVRNSIVSTIKRELNRYKSAVDFWIFDTNLDFSVPNYYNRDTDYWDRITYCFRNGGYGYMRKYNFVDTYFEANWGWIAELEGNIRKPLICLMVKKENIPFVKANLLMDISIPDGVVEGWVLDELDTPTYPKQSLRKSFKERIFPEITAQGISIMKKTRAELDEIYFHFKEPSFKTVVSRNNWLEEIGKKFITAEKLKHGIVEKPKFSFNSVKTGINSQTLTIA